MWWPQLAVPLLDTPLDVEDDGPTLPTDSAARRLATRPWVKQRGAPNPEQFLQCGG